MGVVEADTAVVADTVVAEGDVVVAEVDRVEVDTAVGEDSAVAEEDVVVVEVEVEVDEAGGDLQRCWWAMTGGATPPTPRTSERGTRRRPGTAPGSPRTGLGEASGSSRLGLGDRGASGSPGWG